MISFNYDIYFEWDDCELIEGKEVISSLVHLLSFSQFSSTKHRAGIIYTDPSTLVDNNHDPMEWKHKAEICLWDPWNQGILLIIAIDVEFFL